MDQKQMEKKISWLDKQRQKDAETIARLTERLEGRDAEIEGFSRQLKELASELARVAGIGGKVGELEDSMRKHREEVSRLVDQASTRKSRRDQDRESVIKSEREQLAKVTIEIKEGLRELEDLRKSVETRRDEEIKIMRAVRKIEERLEGQILFDEEKALMLASLEEGRKHDAKRLTDIQAEGSDLRERLELVRSNTDSMEDRMSRTEVRVGRVISGENERREAQDLWMEQQVAKLVEFEREWKSWLGHFAEFQKVAEEIDSRTLAYDETYRTLRQLQTELASALEKVERRIHEISEMQRLAEDRLGQEWTAFQGDEQKRWNTHKLTLDERWREHSRVHEKLAAEVASLSDSVKDLLQGLSEMQEIDRQRVLELLASLREWAAEFDARPNARS
jgi:chromosome segregation ATPase